MAEGTKIGGYEAMTLQVGYIFAGEVAHEMWQLAADHEVDSSRLINVEMTIDALEESDEPLSETE